MIGLGQLAFGAGVLGSGAFDATATTTADFRILVEIDLALTPGRPGERYVETDEDGRVTAINIDGTDSTGDGLNQRARTRFEKLVDLTNNGDVPVHELYFEFEVTDAGLQGSDPTPSEIEEALQIVSATGEIDATGDVDFFTISEDEDVDDGELGPGESLSFGIQVDLLPNSGIGSLDTLPDPDRFDVTLTIRAEMD